MKKKKLLIVVGAVLLLLGRDESAFSRIPFGPYLALGAAVWLFWGPRLVEWYFSLLRPGMAPGGY